MDTAGHLLAVYVHEADVNDREGVQWLLRQAHGAWPTLQHLWADQAYTGDWRTALREQYGIELEIVAKPAEQQGFAVLPRRWAVERTIAWVGRDRRLSKDYEHEPDYSATWVYLASIRLLLRRLQPDPAAPAPYRRYAA